MNLLKKRRLLVALTIITVIIASWFLTNHNVEHAVIINMYQSSYRDEERLKLGDIRENIILDTKKGSIFNTSTIVPANVIVAATLKEQRNHTLRLIPMNMIHHMAPEIIKYIGKERLANFKNPCWYEADDILYCFPYFYILGITKCGSTDMWRKVTEHPQVISSINKEWQWWTQGRYNGRDPAVSLKKLLTLRGSKYLDRPSGKHPNSTYVFGDGSPSTFWDNHNWRTIFPNRTDGPPYVVADLIHAVHPEAKLIVTFREPVERMYSSYHFFKKTHTSAEDFHQNIVDRLQIFARCRQTNSVRACAYQDFLNAPQIERMKPTMHIGMGIYYVYLEDWLSVYPGQQLFISELRDWSQNCTTRLPQLFKFLELQPLTPSKIETMCASRKKSATKYSKDPMWNTTRALLQDFYQPFNRKLYNMLQDTRFKWDYSSNITSH